MKMWLSHLITEAQKDTENVGFYAEQGQIQTSETWLKNYFTPKKIYF